MAEKSKIISELKLKDEENMANYQKVKNYAKKMEMKRKRQEEQAQKVGACIVYSDGLCTLADTHEERLVSDDKVLPLLSGHFTSATVDLTGRLKQVGHEVMTELAKWKREDAKLEQQFLFELTERGELIEKTSKHYAASLRLGGSRQPEF